MNKERLTLLAAKLLTVPRHKFNMENWRADPQARDYSKDLLDEDLINADCGTSGCAFGWACAMPEFNEQGLRWQNIPVYGRFIGWDAAIAFFELEMEQAKLLFSWHSYEHSYSRWDAAPRKLYPSEVSERITAFVAGKFNKEDL